MNDAFVPFDRMRRRVETALEASDAVPDTVYLVRDLFGKVRISVSDSHETDDAGRNALRALANRLFKDLGAHGHPPEEAVLFVSDSVLSTLGDSKEEIRPGVYWADRLVTGGDWWTVSAPRPEGKAKRVTLFSVKGGVGRSTTIAVLAQHLARKGERVLVLDLDLESPGLSSAMLDERAQPEFGIADWFVEDLVGQGDHVVERMTAAPAWASDSEGDVRVAPAHGHDPGEYLAKLGRVYMDVRGTSWAQRLERLLGCLEDRFEPTTVLLESRSGLHDIAAATVTDLNAEVLLFAVDSESTWTDYNILFRHWRDRGLAAKIRERLSIVSALTPELDPEKYLQVFRERAWDLFRDYLYDDLEPSAESGDGFSFDLSDESAPHDPIIIDWNRGLAAGASLRDLERTAVKLAYTSFLTRFDQLVSVDDSGEEV